MAKNTRACLEQKDGILCRASSGCPAGEEHLERVTDKKKGLGGEHVYMSNSVRRF